MRLIIANRKGDQTKTATTVHARRWQRVLPLGELQVCSRGPGALS